MGLTDAAPLGRNRTWGAILPEEAGDPDAPGFGFFPHLVGPGYLPTMQIPLVAGRNLSPDDQEDTEPVLLLNETGAQRLFHGEAAVGRQIRMNG